MTAKHFIFLTLTICPTMSNACPATEPLWALPPNDPAVDNPPANGYYFMNEDQSIWASAWWAGEGNDYLPVTEEGIKVGWFRPDGIP